MYDDLRRESLAVLFLDLDRFKSINDTLGHAAGDTLLQVVASRLLAELPTVPQEEGSPQPAVARLGGDEFMILLPAPTDSDAAEAAIFLASERARMITGQTLVVNAGHFYPVA